jgi:cobalt/nickel transport system permease protein
MNLLLAVHLADGVLDWPWLAAGLIFLPIVLWWGLWNLREEEIPRIAVMSAAFFIATLIHVKAPVGSTHLLLNGLVGVILGRRAAVAIPLGLLLQATLFGHGGLTVLGVNTVVMLLPALLVAGLFRLFQRSYRFTHARYRWAMGCGLGVAGVLGTSVFFFLTLLFGSSEDLSKLAWIAFVTHLPIMVIEGLLTAVTINFLYRVKPSMLGITPFPGTLPATAPPTGPVPPSPRPHPSVHPHAQSVPDDPGA